MAYAEFQAEGASNYLIKLNAIMQNEVIGRASKRGADYLRDRIAANTPLGPTKNLFLSIESKAIDANIPIKGQNVRIQSGESVVYSNPKIAPHAHLVIYGHAVYFRGKRLVPERRTRANPFFSRTDDREENNVQKEISKSVDSQLASAQRRAAQGKPPTARERKLSAIDNNTLRRATRQQDNEINSLRAIR